MQVPDETKRQRADVVVDSGLTMEERNGISFSLICQETKAQVVGHVKQCRVPGQCSSCFHITVFNCFYLVSHTYSQ